MRERSRIVQNLETLYREAFARAEADDDRERMAELDFQFQRDQLYFEAMLDVRDAIVSLLPEEKSGEGVTSLLEKAKKLKDLTRLRP